MKRRYAIWDVFTDKPLSGNPLAIVLDTEGLSDSAMQAIAAELNLSETVFVLPSELPAHTARLRIFTPKMEIPFAGHPTVGAAIQLTIDRMAGDADVDALIILEQQIGSIRVGVAGKGGNAPYAEFDVPKLPVETILTIDHDRIAAAIGLDERDIGFADHKPTKFNAGSTFAFIPIRDLDAMGRAHVVPAHWSDAFEGKVFLYCKETIRHDASFHVRVFAPGLGIEEDPATGSAVAAFAGVIHRFDQLPEGESDALIEQGIEMGRPSQIKLEVEVLNQNIRRVRIGGHARQIMSGTLNVD